MVEPVVLSLEEVRALSDTVIGGAVVFDGSFQCISGLDYAPIAATSQRTHSPDERPGYRNKFTRRTSGHDSKVRLPERAYLARTSSICGPMR